MQTQTYKKLYCAARIKGVYKICTIGPCNELHPLGNCRPFHNWEEAAICAQDIAHGKYSDYWEAGKYINMR